MINGKDIYDVFAAIVPLYVAMILAYGSVKWWKIFSPDQCSGINRFVALFAVPLLSFHFISSNNPYAMNLRFIAADTLQKLTVLLLLSLWANLSRRELLLLILELWRLTKLLSKVKNKNFVIILFSPSINNAGANAGQGSNKELHMFVWSSSASPGSEANLRNAVNRAASADFGALEANKVTFQGLNASSENASPARKAGELEIEDGFKSPIGKSPLPVGSPFMAQKKPQRGAAAAAPANGYSGGPTPANASVAVTSMMHECSLDVDQIDGILFNFRWNIEMPTIIKGSISILSDAGLGMAMFSLGLFMALQPRIIACGKAIATFSMAVRFLTGPAVIAATSIAIGLRGVLLHVAIVQAALPQGIVPFVFAKEYNCHPDILSTAVIFGMLIALPITILYYVLLGV
ncbi:auxin efflux carrier component 2-like [Asparagus officinalis]|uniref:auxin efflux carrier component 2-like n=1 Tax=Asparagus officinalis TaxID=4686 RepID=UPI00098E2903|nr:auxin efflux carrier component 2-like [Asparagus officinalis]